jgi:hypothetical protein
VTSFDDRKDAFEKKYAHDQEMMFRLEARTSKLFGLWAADQLGLSGEDAKAYAADMVASNLAEAGFSDIKQKARKDFDEKGVAISDHVIETMVHKYMQDAKSQLESHS